MKVVGFENMENDDYDLCHMRKICLQGKKNKNDLKMNYIVKDNYIEIYIEFFCVKVCDTAPSENENNQKLRKIVYCFEGCNKGRKVNS